MAWMSTGGDRRKRRVLLRARGLAGALSLAIALACFPSAGSAQADSPLSWSAPALIDHQAPFGQPQQLHSVSCPSASLCVAGNSAGNVVTSTNPTGGAGAWTISHVDGTDF